MALKKMTTAFVLTKQISVFVHFKIHCSSSSEISASLKPLLQYEQGQSPEPKIREYFYYIDHQGQLFLDDARMKNFTSCFKDKEFLAFFFRRLRRNSSERYASQFPFLSLCGRERNFVRCDDLPIVYTDIFCETDKKGGHEVEYLSYCNGGNLLKTPFNPAQLNMNPKTGRVIYPADEKLGGLGLVKSALALEFSKVFQFRNGQNNPPTGIFWNGIYYDTLPIL